MGNISKQGFDCCLTLIAIRLCLLVRIDNENAATGTPDIQTYAD